MWQTRRSTRTTERANSAAEQAQQKLTDLEAQKVRLAEKEQELRVYTEFIDRLQAHLESQDRAHERDLREERRRYDALLREFEDHRARCGPERADLQQRLDEAQDRADRALRQAHLLASLVTDEITRAAALDGLDEPLPEPDLEERP